MRFNSAKLQFIARKVHAFTSEVKGIFVNYCILMCQCKQIISSTLSISLINTITIINTLCRYYTVYYVFMSYPVDIFRGLGPLLSHHDIEYNIYSKFMYAIAQYT